MKSRSWLNLVDAVRAVRDARGVSDGAACTLLARHAHQTLRSRKRPWPEPDEPPEPIYDHWSPPIPIEDWHGASIDLEHGWLILAGGELMRADIEINADDLRYWLKSQRAAPNKQKAVGKRPRVKKQLAEMFPEGVPDPGDCPRKDLRAELLKHDPSLCRWTKRPSSDALKNLTLIDSIDPIRSGSDRFGMTGCGVIRHRTLTAHIMRAHTEPYDEFHHIRARSHED